MKTKLLSINYDDCCNGIKGIMFTTVMMLVFAFIIIALLSIPYTIISS